MRVVKYEPFNELASLQSEVNRLFRDTLTKESENNAWLPSIDISESQEGFKIKADLPGIKKEAIDISFLNNVLTIKGERSLQKDESNACYYRKEIRYGNFQRQINLGNDIDQEKINASFKDGVLDLFVPKSEKSKTKKINID